MKRNKTDENIKSSKAFTLIELLVVIALIGILAGIIVVSMSGSQESARDARIKNEMAQLRTSVEIYGLINQDYEGVSSDGEVSKLLSSITSQGGSPTLSVSANGSTFCITSSLNSTNDSWCVDHNGYSGLGGCTNYQCNGSQGGYSGGTLAEGLVGYWTMDQDDSSGTTLYDQSPYGNHGTIYGATFAPDRHGNSNSAMSFDGTDDYIQISNIFPDDQTISAWIKTLDVSAIGNKHYQTVAILHQENSGAANDWGFGIDTNGMLVYGNGDSISEYNVTSLSAVNDNIGHFVAVTREKSSGKIELYIDGVKSNSGFGSTTSLTDASRSGNGVQIGRSGDASPVQYFNGLIDDVRIYNRALSESEIQQLYQLGI